MKNLKLLFLENDIFPLGKFETKSVSAALGGEAYSYPDVVKLNIQVEVSSLLTEARTHINFIGKKYVKERVSHLVSEISQDDVRSVLTSVGFTKESYQSYSLRKLGTNELEDFILPGTRDFFEKFPTECFRMQYAVAQPKWQIQFHRDHDNFRIHGFRAMVPLSSSVFICFFKNEMEIVYELRPGMAYFVNIARLHRAFNPHNSERINLIFQMNSDSLVAHGTAQTALGTDVVNSRYAPFLSSEIGEIWK